MKIKFFGDYLLSKELISKEQYEKIVAFQSQNNHSLGTIAVNEGLLTKDEAQTINERQLSHDQKFGNIAKELGLLDEHHLELLLKKQKEQNIPFGEVVEKMGFLSKEILQNELEEFKLSQKNRTKHVFKELAFFDTDDLIKESIIIFEKLYLRVTKKSLKVEKIDYFTNQLKDKTLILQSISGKYNMQFALVVNNETQANIISSLLKEDIDECKNDPLCLLREFMNMFLINLLVDLISHEIDEDTKDNRVVKSEDLDIEGFFKIDFLSTKGTIELYVKI